MRKQVYLLLCMFFCVLSAKAAPGDTTWVQAQYGINLDWFGDYDTTITFPNGSSTYRRVYMTFTLGKHSCPGYDPNNPGDQAGQTGWCGDWDYTVQTYLMTPTGDTFELGRLITPYARQNMPRTPLTWKEHYYFDVTDFYPVLKNNGTIRIHYSGYSGGFTGDVKFAFVEGTPERDVLGIDRTYYGNFGYGNAGDPIENHLPLLNKTAPASTQYADFKFTITGHGSDANYCGEFCKKYYQVFCNTNQIDQRYLWRDDCGANHLYPQSGTWIYERANWCPGDLVHVNTHPLPVSAAGPYSLNVDMEPYTANGGAVETIESEVFYYGQFNKNLDASLDDIIAPTGYEGHFRQNPLCGMPTLHVKNTGATAITSMKFEYGIQGHPMAQYTWTGSLASLHDTDVVMPNYDELSNLSYAGDTAHHTFIARIMEVNTQAADADTTNNTLTSSFVASPAWGLDFIVSLHTNQDPNGTSWAVYDQSGNIVAQRNNTATGTYYNDTVHVGPGCYKFVVTDGDCDGLYFFDQNNAGSLSVRKMKTGIPVYYTLSGNFGGNFGCGFTQYFTANFPLSVTNLSEIPLKIEAYPNPAQNTVNINISGVANVSGTVQLIDALGRVVLQKECNNANEILNTGSLSNGMYTIVFTDKNDPSARLQTRLLIAK